MGVCYEPFHHKDYPKNIKKVLTEDFSIMKNYASVVRTYYAGYYGEPVVKYAAQAGMKLYLGIFLTNESWGNKEFDMAAQAVKGYPDTISAVIIGNENLPPSGQMSANELKKKIVNFKKRINNKVPVGTAQRISEVLKKEYTDLYNECDIIGVQIYPFFSTGYNPSKPLDQLDKQWKLAQKALGSNASKMRITETGWPSQGGGNQNKASLQEAKNYYQAFKKWQGGKEKFYFTMFDRTLKQAINGGEFERYFGILTVDGKPKFK